VTCLSIVVDRLDVVLDGAHHCHAECFQALNDVGFTIAANAGVY
jgi:hypothetical protein